MTSKRTLIAAGLIAIASPLAFLTSCWGDTEHSGHSTGSHTSTPSAHHQAHHESHVVKAGPLEISSAWTRATVKTAKVGGGYITIKNTGDTPDRLIAGAADFAQDVQIHQMTLVGDVMRMRPLEGGVEIPAGGEVTLKPGAEHLMFMGLKEVLVEGETTMVTLKFESAGDVSVPFHIYSIAARKPEGHGNHDGHAH